VVARAEVPRPWWLVPVQHGAVEADPLGIVNVQGAAHGSEKGLLVLRLA
jgi:hypothetical protein